MLNLTTVEQRGLFEVKAVSEILKYMYFIGSPTTCSLHSQKTQSNVIIHYFRQNEKIKRQIMRV